MTMPHPPARVARALAIAALGFGILAGPLAGAASAKEIGSGGGTVTTTTCNPVSTLTYKGDARVGETGVADIQVDWGVKPCNKETVKVDVTMWESKVPSNVVYADPAAPTSGRITVAGVKVNTSYQVKVTVTDAGTGALLGSKQISAAANRKVGV